MSNNLANTQLDPASGGAVGSPGSTGLQKLEYVLLRYAMVWILLIVVAIATIYYPGFFLWGNIRNILSQNAPLGMLALGMTFVIICGGFDLSVGGTVVLASVLYAGFSNDMSLPMAFVATLGVGLFVGLFNAVAVTVLRVNAFVATLATASLVTAAALIYSDSGPVMSDNTNFSDFGTASVLGMPVVGWVLICSFVVGGVVLARSVYGRSVYVVGGNYEAARLAGIRVKLVQGSTYLLTGGAAAIAGVMLASQTGIGQPQVVGDFTLEAIAIVIIGGTSLLGGEGAIWRTAIGLLIIATIKNLFDSLALDTAVQSLVQGLIVLFAVTIDSYSRRRRG